MIDWFNFDPIAAMLSMGGANRHTAAAGGFLIGMIGNPRQAVFRGLESYAARSGIRANKIAGDVAADFLNSVYGGTREVSRSTSLGTRYLDNLADGVAMESKVGRTSLSSRVDLQIQKDVELLNTPGSGVNAVEWHFFPGKTGVGPTAPLLQQLESCGFTVCIHR